MDGVGDRGGHFEVVAGAGAVGVHDVEDDFAGSEGLGFFGPIKDVDVGIDATAVDEDVPVFAAGVFDAVGVETENGCAAAEFAGDLGEEVGIFNGCGVEGDFFSAGLDESGGVIEGADAAADGEGHEDVFHDAADQVSHDVATFVGGGDVIEDEFVEASSVWYWECRKLDGVSSVDVVEEFHAFDDPAAINVEARDDSAG